MMKSFSFLDFEFITEINLDETLNTPEDKRTGCFSEVDLKCLVEIRKKTK